MTKWILKSFENCQVIHKYKITIINIISSLEGEIVYECEYKLKSFIEHLLCVDTYVCMCIRIFLAASNSN